MYVGIYRVDPWLKNKPQRHKKSISIILQVKSSYYKNNAYLN